MLYHINEQIICTRLGKPCLTNKAVAENCTLYAFHLLSITTNMSSCLLRTIDDALLFIDNHNFREEQKPRPRKILFLDVDGVLNCKYPTYDESDIEPNSKLNISMLKRLKRIFDATDCYFVLSSSWRHHTAWKELLFNAMNKVNIDVDRRYIDDTPRTQYTNRGRLIQEYLDECDYEISKWCILDDTEVNKPYGYNNGFIVRTDEWNGLTDVEMNKIINLMSDFFH